MTERGSGASDRAGALADPYDRDAMLAEVLTGLRAPVRHIPSKYHYDEVGSELFERITRLDEYYLTRTERGLLERWIPEWVGQLRPQGLVELGAGSADKSRILLDAMVRHAPDPLYVPVDVSGDFLHAVADKLRAEYEGLRVEPEVADISGTLSISHELPEPSWIAFLGSTLGNFEPAGAARLLGRLTAKLRGDDRFLLGVDLRPGPGKSRERLELAYNDRSGVTEQFSRNVLRVLNRELGADFDIDAFRYVSFYDEERGRIETHQEAMHDQVVRFGDGSEVDLRAGERIRTEISAKYDRSTIEGLFAGAGLAVDRWVEDNEGLYALVLGALARPTPAEPCPLPTSRAP
jgi:L-histidine N-alpha-methyltransferase